MKDLQASCFSHFKLARQPRSSQEKTKDPAIAESMDSDDGDESVLPEEARYSKKLTFISELSWES